jgi:hypothetical protein
MSITGCPTELVGVIATVAAWCTGPLPSSKSILTWAWPFWTSTD